MPLQNYLKVAALGFVVQLSLAPAAQAKGAGLGEVVSIANTVMGMAKDGVLAHSCAGIDALHAPTSRFTQATQEYVRGVAKKKRIFEKNGEAYLVSTPEAEVERMEIMREYSQLASIYGRIEQDFKNVQTKVTATFCPAQWAKVRTELDFARDAIFIDLAINTLGAVRTLSSTK